MLQDIYWKRDNFKGKIGKDFIKINNKEYNKVEFKELSEEKYKEL